MKKVWLMALVIFLIPSTALAGKAESQYQSDWQYVLTQVEVTYYVDMNSPSVTQNILSFWLKAERSRKHEMVFSKMVFDAKSQKIRCQERHVYNSLSKKVIFTSKAASPWGTVESNSPMIPILEYITQKHPLFRKQAA
ncbi:hypothetical protein [Propionispora sp. 2/2-37]|uniref:hypothetical protein n=1 Tax=Propionispora sp. 2/2-37 TaxID=1677858 RepID=UPI0012E32C28|nr:hypothetical protein [Propionispora sp. 2/2-37]